MNTSNFVSIPASMFEDQEILVFDQHRLTYGQLWENIQRFANALRAVGVGRGDCVAVLQTNSHRYVEAYYATAHIGAVFLPLNYRAKLPELEYMITTAQAKVLIVGDRYHESVAQLRPTFTSVQTYISMETPRDDMLHLDRLIAEASPEFEPPEVEDEDTTILMYTSGTTALPKAVLTYNDFTAYVTANVELADGTPRGTSLLCVPLYHIAGATNVMTNMFTGRKLVLLRQFDAAEWLRTVEREQVTHAFLVPTMVKQLIDHPDFATYDLSSLQNLSYGGAAMPFPVIRRAIEMFPKTVGFVNAFGQTETTSTLTVLGPDDHRLDGAPHEVELRLKRLKSIGRPLPDVELKVVDDDGKKLPTGQVGELWVRTPRVMKGYGSSSGTTSPLVQDGWLPTRDMGWLDEDGYIFLAGRKDDMIIRGGENIAPAEVEAVIYSHPGVDEAAVIGIPDVEWGQRVAAVIVPRPGVTLTADEIIEFCRQRLASFKKPTVIQFRDALPKNPMGKILKKDLRVQLAEAGA